VAEFMGQNLAVFAGKVAEGESTVMPKSRSWLRETIQENANSQDVPGSVWGGLEIIYIYIYITLYNINIIIVI